MIKCCKSCTERSLGCHDYCPKYITEKTAALEARIKMDNDYNVTYGLSQMKKGRGKRKK